MVIEFSSEEFEKYFSSFQICETCDSPDIESDNVSQDEHRFIQLMKDLKVEDPNTDLVHLKITPLYKHVGEALINYNLLGIIASNSVAEHLIHLSMHHVNLLSVVIQGRITPLLESDLGETLDTYDIESHVISIGEKVSCNPDIYAVYIEGNEAQTQYLIKREIKYENNITKIMIRYKMKTKFKKSGFEFICEQPSFIARKDEKSVISCEYIGLETIKHIKSLARVESQYSKTENKPSEPFIYGYFYFYKGKIYDCDDSLYGTFEGNYITNLVLTNAKTSKTEELWRFESENESFNDLAHFKKFLGDTFNDYESIKCPTDCRHKINAESLKPRNLKNDENMIKNKDLEKETKENNEYKPKWFKPVKCEDTGEIWYQYTNKYWHAKQKGGF